MTFIPLVSALLDPRFKEVSFSALALDRAKKLILTLMRRVNADEAHSSADNVTHVISDNEDAPDSPEKKNLWDSFEEKLKKKKASHHLVTQHNKDEYELALYLSVPYIDKKDNPLNWWIRCSKGISSYPCYVNPLCTAIFCCWIHQLSKKV